jgi:transcriptional regulator with PAS, ATPase and Fis domain
VPTDSVLPLTNGVGDAPSDPINVTALQDVADPWRRSRLAEEVAKQLRTLTAIVLDIRREAVRELVDKHGAHHTRVARHLGVSRARVGQLVATASADALTAEVVA